VPCPVRALGLTCDANQKTATAVYEPDIIAVKHGLVDLIHELISPPLQVSRQHSLVSLQILKDVHGTDTAEQIPSHGKQWAAWFWWAKKVDWSSFVADLKACAVDKLSCLVDSHGSAQISFVKTLALQALFHRHTFEERSVLTPCRSSTRGAGAGRAGARCVGTSL